MPEITPSKYLTQAGWKDVPHLDEQTQKELLESTPPYMRDARSKGDPSLGSGAIYPIELSEVQCPFFPIPAHWPRCYALDVGWNCTAALWAALDRQSDTWYAYTEHYRGKAEPSTHATAIKARGEWIPGLIDPAARGRGQYDGRQLLAAYVNLGLKLTEAKNALDAGIEKVWLRLATGRFKVFNTLTNFEAEYRIYRRDEKGAVVTVNDHLMDCMRYIVLSGETVAATKPIPKDSLSGAKPLGGDPDVAY